MTWIELFFHRFSASRRLSRAQIYSAFAVALIIDGVQFALGPFGWLFVDQGLDVLAMVLISWAIGFHMLLLPTFVIELIPGPDMLPTWTACTAAVVMLRRKNQPKPTIDISSEVTSVPTTPGPNDQSAPPKIAQTAKVENS